MMNESTSVMWCNSQSDFPGSDYLIRVRDRDARELKVGERTSNLGFIPEPDLQVVKMDCGDGRERLFFRETGWVKRVAGGLTWHEERPLWLRVE